MKGLAENELFGCVFDGITFYQCVVHFSSSRIHSESTHQGEF